MNISIEFEHDWDKSILARWIDNHDDESFDEYSRNEIMEISVLADLSNICPSVSLSTLKELAKSEIETAIELGFDEIICRWFSHKSINHEIQRISKTNSLKENS